LLANPGDCGYVYPRRRRADGDAAGVAEDYLKADAEGEAERVGVAVAGSDAETDRRAESSQGGYPALCC